MAAAPVKSGQLPAPIESLTAPTESLPAPIESLLAPIETLPAPIESLPAPIETLLAPIESLPAPIETLLAPIESLPAPIETLLAPIESLLAPIESLPAAASIARGRFVVAGPSVASSSVEAPIIRPGDSSAGQVSHTTSPVSSKTASAAVEITYTTAVSATNTPGTPGAMFVIDSTSFVSAASTTVSSAWTEPSAALLMPASSSPGGLGAGQVAGIAIGCAVAGLLAGLVAACALLRRRSQYANVANAMVFHDETKDSATETTVQVIGGGNGNGDRKTDNEMNRTNGIQLNHFLLEATPDRDIAQEVQSLGELIHQHVENYYHTKPVLANTQSLSAALASLGFSSDATSSRSSIPAQSMAVLCQDADTRLVGLRHVIMRAAFSSIDFDLQHGCSNITEGGGSGGSLPSLLPEPMVSLLRTMPAHEEETGDGNAQDGKAPDGATATTAALREWRRLSAFLLHPERHLRTALPVREAAAAEQAQKLAQRLNVLLSHFVETAAGAAPRQERHLQAVLLECATLGNVLLSHPSDWRLVVDDDASSSASSSLPRRRAVVVEAGLDRLGDRDGPRYRRPQRVVEPVVVYCSF
ncbi:hypothetical protein E4U21_002432 [Claviceps maximensis]|nr:hypothetical protein E4U21_002432 [Claviceps maximensis]